MMKPFEPFEAARPSSAGRRGAPIVRVRPDGRLVLNSTAIRAIKSAGHVQLLWDTDTDRFGLRPTTRDDRLAFRVSYGPSQATITAKEFVDTHRIPVGARFRLALESDIWVAVEQLE